MTALIQEAVLPALERLDWQYLQMPESSGLVVPLACPEPASAAFLVVVETNDETSEAIVHTGVCMVPHARRAAVALLLAEFNTLYRFVTFSMGREGEVRVDAGVQFQGVVPEMRPACVELAFRRLSHALYSTHAKLLQTATRRGRRPRLEREVDELLRDMDD